MADIGGRKYFEIAITGVKKELDTAFRQVSAAARPIILSAADLDGNLDPQQEQTVKVRVGNDVMRLFVGADQRSPYGADGITPLAEIPRILNTWYVYVVAMTVSAHHNWMKRRLPDDVFNFLSTTQRRMDIQELSKQDKRKVALHYMRHRVSAVFYDPNNLLLVQENEFLRRPGESDDAFRQRLDDLRIFRPNPQAELDPDRRWVPMHQWNDPNGYRLSDRVWQNGMRTRAKIDAMIGEAFREGWSAQKLANMLEQFLVPSRADLRTSRPYGVNASADAMRLARTEIARAANQAAFISAYANPYTSGIDVARSPNGSRTCPICPLHATLDFGGARLRPPYDFGGANIPPYHPHDMCYVLSVLRDDIGTTTRQLRAVIEDDRRELLEPVMNPANLSGFVEQLIGRSLMNLAAQVTQLPLF